MTGHSTIDPDLLRQRYSVDGATVDEISAEIGRDRRAIYTALHREGIPLRGTPGVSEWGDVLTHDYLSACADDGWSTYRIAQEVGADWSVVAEWQAHHGLADRVDDATLDLVRRWYEVEGCSINEVARRAKIGRRTARRWLLEAGVTMRPRGRPKSS